MNKIIFLSLFFVGLCSYHPFAQITIIGTLINNENKKPISSASVFLSNATIGTKTANDGTFRLHVITPGKYRLVITCLGFKTYYQYINLSNGTVDLHNIELLVKTALLKEVE